MPLSQHSVVFKTNNKSRLYWEERERESQERKKRAKNKLPVVSIEREIYIKLILFFSFKFLLSHKSEANLKLRHRLIAIRGLELSNQLPFRPPFHNRRPK